MSGVEDCSKSPAGRQGEHSGSDCSGSRGEDSGSDRGGRGGLNSGEDGGAGEGRDGNLYVIAFLRSTGGAQ